MSNHHSPTALPGQFQIEVFGTDLTGCPFTERTRTLTVTRDGGTIGLDKKLAPDSELIVRNPITNEEAVVRVVDLIRDDDVLVQVYGITFVDSTSNLWHAQCKEVEPNKTAVLECSRCHCVAAFLVSGIELEILEAKRTARRFCKCSVSTTIWNQTDRRVTEPRAAARAASDRREHIRIGVTSASVPQERRKVRRTAMKVPAFIRTGQLEDVVECEDLSRGGFSFKSQRTYFAGMPIEAAVPYAKGSVNIFVPARISYRQQLSAGLYKYGVEYVKPNSVPSV